MPRSLFLFLALVTGVLMLVVDQTRPPIPVDETRYLTVAWEFWVRGQYILPTLNFEPYHHKPPMLFWLINLMWAVFGETHLWAARLVPYLATLGTLFMTYRLGRALWPDTEEPATIATLMMAATPFFMVYSGLIMFDTLLTVAVLGALYAIVRFYQTIRRIWFLALGVAIGAGILIKGPVVVLHILPPLLLFPLWQRPFDVSRHVWAQGIVIAMLFAAIIGLTWALPAAHLGGPDYQRMIFWGQSAGRMVQSFDHGHPWWFYIVFVPFLLLPWPFVPQIWRGCTRVTGLWHLTSCSLQSKFILAWIVPVFIAFSAISGKQVHYLIPLMPGFFLLMGHYISSRGLVDSARPLRLFITACTPITIVLAFVIGFEYYIDLFGPHLLVDISAQLLDDNEEILLAALVFAGFIGFTIRTWPQKFSTPRMLKMVVLAHAAGITALHLSIAPMLKTYYDLGPIAERVIAERETGRPVAVANPWHGELGYVTRQPTHYDELIPDQIPAWFANHPNGLVLYRMPNKTVLDPNWAIVFQQPYRSPDKLYTILETK
jgi:4-amino-4-deoxy-L-arabinose transferase-like glycosyltransferase